MDMSLDDIIKTKKIPLFKTKKFANTKSKAITYNRSSGPAFAKNTTKVQDARLKIIQKNRAKIRDARDKLIELTRDRKEDIRKVRLYKPTRPNYSNVRNAFNNMQLTEMPKHLPTNNLIMGRGNMPLMYCAEPENEIIPLPSSRRQRLAQPPVGYIDYDNMEQLENEEYIRAAGLSRTVRNDAMYDIAPPAPRRLNTWGGSSKTNEQFDPFEVYQTSNNEREVHSIPVSHGNNNDVFVTRRYVPEHSTQLSYEMRTRLERAPDPHASMGIFANSHKNNSTNCERVVAGNGYRIVVSNLHTSVTQADIKELFEDVGDLFESRMVRPGIAEVVYKNLVDAEKAVDTYHNRQLDGQPMKCLLVNPRASNKPTAPAMRSAGNTSSTKSSLEIDIDALHKVLFRRH